MADSDLRQFMHELLTRFENLARAMETRLAAQTLEMREQAAAMREQAAAMRKQGKTMEDLSEEILAQRSGLLEVLDHLRRADGTT